MRTDVTSMFFNSSIDGKTATPAWGTSIGQSKQRECRIDDFKPEVINMLVGMTYKCVSDLSKLDASKGSSKREILICSLFTDIFINNIKVENSQFVLLLVREHSESHDGRLIISYAPYIKYNGIPNQRCIDEMQKSLNCNSNGCWFVYDISIKEQSELYFKAVVVDAEKPRIYDKTTTSQMRSAEWNAMIPEEDLLKPSTTQTSLQIENGFSFQQIFYGAPGTGKSYRIKGILEEKNVPDENIFRTTFHPDSDYSTFVGAYKPTMEKQKDKIYTKEELISKLTVMKNSGVPYSSQKFGAKYWRSLKQLNLADKKEILQACGMSDNYTVEFDKGTAVGEEYLAGLEESRIIYSFVPQTFLNAYIRAYQTNDNVYLIIEEINRGNCAQIFGDLFQLLDRDKTGNSEYTIKADADLKTYLEEKLGENNPGIKNGELCLPSNLYIFATMNTSDQSLFPIDSAFKRRWDWKYEPIKYKNTDWKIYINEHKYSWVSFQKEVNKRIFDVNHSEDKMLGDYFVNPTNDVITADLLKDKILFYLWNEVCKDGEGEIFRTSETDEIKFSDLYGKDGNEKLLAMMNYLLKGAGEYKIGE